jgi:CheY-like chemotaxis protein
MSAAASARAHVLVVDDEPLVARAVKRVLHAQYDVTLASSADEALERLRSGERFDVVFCDLMMPGKSGMDLHRAVLAEAPAVADRFVFLTGGAFTPEADEYLRRSGAPHVTKPFDSAALRDLVAGMI